MSNFIQNVSMFFGPVKEKDLSPLAVLKQVFDRAIVKYQLATGIETASSILGLTNAMDLIRIEGKDIHNLTDLRNKISQIDTEEKIWKIATELLNSKDSVLSLCVADFLAQYLKEPQPFDLKGKTYTQLQQLSVQGKEFIYHLQKSVDEMVRGTKAYKG
jgi:hypothetical protein